jgi:hypothetical protein
MGDVVCKTAPFSSASEFCTRHFASLGGKSLHRKALGFAPSAGVPVRPRKTHRYCAASAAAGTTNLRARRYRQRAKCQTVLLDSARPRIGCDRFGLSKSIEHNGKLDDSRSPAKFQQEFLATFYTRRIYGTGVEAPYQCTATRFGGHC